jgi:hypothetical protein
VKLLLLSLAIDVVYQQLVRLCVIVVVLHAIGHVQHIHSSKLLHTTCAVQSTAHAHMLTHVYTLYSVFAHPVLDDALAEHALCRML